MMYLVYALVAAFLISLISLIGAVLIFGFAKWFERLLLFLVSLSAGSLIGGAFFHLLPEALEMNDDPMPVFIFVLVGFCLFFVLERVLRWHHCHKDHCETHLHVGWLNLIGDGVHNFIDGLVIASAFAAGPVVGVPVALSIASHEIPQELGDFGVLIFAGFTRFKALAFNLLSALLSLVGVVFGYLLINQIAGINLFLLSFAAGGFIYIAASDLIPEIHEEKSNKKSIYSFIFFLSALVIMYVLKIIGAE